MAWIDVDVQINGLKQLVSEFDDVRRPKFADGSKCVVPFPFKEWEEEHHYTLPDILMSFPGEHDDDDSWALTPLGPEIRYTSHTPRRPTSHGVP